MDGDNCEDLTDLELERIIEFVKKLNDIIKYPVEKVDEETFTEKIIRILRYQKFDVDAAVVALKKGLTLRLVDELGNMPYEEYKRVYDEQIFLILKERAPDGSKIIWIRQQNWNVDEIDFLTYLAALFHYVDEALHSNITQKHGFSYIIDYSGVGIVKLAKIASMMTTDIMRQLAAINQGGLPCKLKTVHIINCPLVIAALYSAFKYLLSKKIRQRFHLHHKGSEILCKYYDQEALPVGLGGCVADENAVDEQLLKLVNKTGMCGGCNLAKYRKYFVIPK